MISWNEQEPDFQLQSLDRLFAQVPFTTAVSLITRFRYSLLLIIDAEVRAGIETHLASHRVEQGGLIIGSVFGGETGLPLIVKIEDSVAADDARGTGVSLIMGSSVWNAAREKCTGMRHVVGWYHSHPNLGAFFSGTDRSTQRAFFSNPHSVGLVSDPIRQEEMWFAGQDSKEVEPFARIVMVAVSQTEDSRV